MFGVGRRGAERGGCEQRLDVEAGSADDDRAGSARLDVDDRGARHSRKAVGVEDLAWITYVNQVVRHAPALGERGFRRADVEATVDLPGVGGDDFDGCVFGQFKGNAGLAGGGGSGDDQQRWSLDFLSCVQQSTSTFYRVMGRNQILDVPTASRHPTR